MLNMQMVKRDVKSLFAKTNATLTKDDIALNCHFNKYAKAIFDDGAAATQTNRLRRVAVPVCHHAAVGLLPEKGILERRALNPADTTLQGSLKTFQAAFSFVIRDMPNDELRQDKSSLKNRYSAFQAALGVGGCISGASLFPPASALR